MTTLKGLTVKGFIDWLKRDTDAVILYDGVSESGIGPYLYETLYSKGSLRLSNFTIESTHLNLSYNGGGSQQKLTIIPRAD